MGHNNGSINHTGNIASAQMNMNMVMVGRQLEKFKQERADLYQKLKVNGSKFESEEDWSGQLKRELSTMLAAIPAENRGGKTLFWSVLDSVLPKPRTKRNSCLSSPPGATDYILLGLNFLDFFLSAEDAGTCLEYQMCQFSRQIDTEDPLMRRIESVLTKGLLHYLGYDRLKDAAYHQGDCYDFFQPHCSE